MENRDKIYEQFKEAAEQAEQKGFDRMEAVWNRVEEKLDNKKKRRAIAWWKYTGVAALLLLFISIGNLIINNNPDTIINPNATPEKNVTVIDTQKINETFNPKHEKVTEEEIVVAQPAVTPTSDNKNVQDSTYYMKAARFTTAKEIDNPKYALQTKAIKEKSVIQSYTKQLNPDGTITFTGTVADKIGPLPGASIVVKGTNITTQSDIDGEFTINVNPSDILTVSYASFDSKEVVADLSNNNANVILNAKELQTVVMDKYRSTTQRKEASTRAALSSQGYVNQSMSNSATISQNASNQYSAVTSNRYPIKKEEEKQDERAAAAITTLSVQEVEDRANASLIQNLQGQVAGLNIATGSGQPGADSTIILRGVGTINENVEPLFIIDGIPVDEDAFRSLSQNDIASYSILKDGVASSIYGSRGSNGVIVITTKSGNYSGDGNYSIEQVQGDREEIRRKIREISTTPRTEKPLYIIDGIAVDDETFKSLNSDEISDLKILKDPYLTAVYGSRGKSGVVLITTNKIIVHRHDIDNEENVNNQQEIKPNPKIQIDNEEYESFEENQFENPAIAPLSTFSIDVDNASYTNLRRFLNNGQTVPKDAVRVEEMINFFKYKYPQPTGKEPFSINTEYSDAPWNPNHKLLKIGLKGVDIPTQELPASNFVFLIDVSGSMNNSNKLPLLKKSMKLLVNQMRAEDRIAIVVYAGAAGLVLPSTSGTEKTKIIAALDNLNAGGSTAGGAGIELAYKTAQENFIKKGNNRVILATDGDFNVGASSNTDMQTLIEEKRKSGVFLTCLGYGMGNYKDSKMEILADKGNGNYAYIDTMQEADRFLQKEFKGSMFAIAKDVKIQIEFNPKHVQSYRLIGYENRKLRDEDFANDAIDAGELGSGHTVTALYEIIPVGVDSDYFTPTPELKYSQPNAATGNYSDELATIKFRHKKPDEDVSKETVKVIPNVSVQLYNASGDFKFAAAVAWFGLKLRDSKLISNKESDAIKKLAKEGLNNDPEGYRAEFIRMADLVE